MTIDKPRDPLKYEPRFTFDPDDKAFKVEGPSSAQIAQDIVLAFNRDIDGKMRKALIDMGWAPPEVVGRFKAAFRVNMLRRAQPGENIDAEIDRVLAELEGE